MSRRGNPFATPEYALLLKAQALRRQHLRRQGPRAVTKVTNLDARNLTTFTPAQQAEIRSMIADGVIEAVLFRTEVYVTWKEMEGFVGPGYDLEDWSRAAAAPPCSEIE